MIKYNNNMKKSLIKLFSSNYAYALRYKIYIWYNQVYIYILYNQAYIYIYIYLLMLLLWITKLSFNLDLSDYLSYYEQENNIFFASRHIYLESLPIYTLPVEQEENLTRVCFAQNNPYICEPTACSADYTEKSTYISIWEKWFGKGISSNYKITPNCFAPKRNTTVLFNEEMINTFKCAFTKEKYGFKKIEIINTTIKNIEPIILPSESVDVQTDDVLIDLEPVCPKILENWDKIFNDYASISSNIEIGLSSNSSESEEDGYFSNSDLTSHFSDSSSDSDSDIVSDITVIPWKPNLDIPTIVITGPDNVNIDSKNFDSYSKSEKISYFSSENFDQTRLYPQYSSFLSINNTVPDKLNIVEKELYELDIETNKYNAENNRLNAVESEFFTSQTGWDDYFKDYQDYNKAESSHYSDEDNIIESSHYSDKDKIFYSWIKDLDIFNVCLSFLPTNDINTFKPLVLDELYRQYNSNTLDLKDLCKVKSIITFTTFEHYSCFKYTNPDAYIKFLDDLDV